MVVCTDALARGMDMAGITVVHYDAPGTLKTYVHRAGRTARAGSGGESIMILGRHECKFWKGAMAGCSQKHVEHYKVPRLLAELAAEHTPTADEILWDEIRSAYASSIDELQGGV